MQQGDRVARITLDLYQQVVDKARYRTQSKLSYCNGSCAVI